MHSRGKTFECLLSPRDINNEGVYSRSLRGDAYRTVERCTSNAREKSGRMNFRGIKISIPCACCSVKTDLMEEGANSTLSIAKVGPTDSGNYTCQLTTMPEQPATIHVHVLNGEDIFIFPSASVAVCR